MSLISRLKSKIDLYGKIEIENELDEKDYSYGKIKSIWAEITPGGGNLKNSEANAIYSEISHKIVIRANSITNLTNDMYFIFKDQRYNIKYFCPNYKYKDSIDIFCSLVVE